jgi:hypothetical protein
MKRIGFLLLLITIFSSNAQAYYIATYYAKLGILDHFNSKGKRLTNAAEIIRQDRFNYHIRKIIDDGDTGDPFFKSKKNRAILEGMLKRGRASWSALNKIINGTPLIKVKIYSDHIDVQVID